MRLATSGSFGSLVMGFLALSGFLACAESPAVPSNTTPEQIQRWASQLGSEDFETREKSEQALKGAGPAAIPLVTKAMAEGDAETKLRGQRVLDELSWAVRPPFSDLARFFPAEAVLLIQTPGLKEAVVKMRAGTPAGKFYDDPALATLKAALGETFARELGLDDAGKDLALTWIERFGGPCAFSLLLGKPDPDRAPREQIVALLGLNAADSVKAYSDFVARFPVGAGQSAQERYRGIPFTHSTHRWRRDAVARVKNLIVRTDGLESMQGLIDGLAGSGAENLAQTPAYAECLTRVDPAPLATLFFNLGPLAKSLERRARDKSEFSALGFEEWKTAIVALQVKEGLFSEQVFCKVVGERKGLVKLLSLPKSPAKLAALCPPGALGFLSLPVSGKDLYADILAITEKIDARDTEQFKTWLAKMEEGAGVKISEQSIPSIQGEAAFWVLKPKGALTYPELYAAIETKDWATATALAEVLAKLVSSTLGAGAARGAEFKGRACHWLKKEAVGPEFPYTFSWCADGARLLAASSQEALQALLNRFDAGTPGLDSGVDFKRLQAQIPAAVRGGLVYVNTAEVAAWGYSTALPLLTELAPEELKGKLADAPKDPAVLFKDFPGTLFSVAGDAEGVRACAVGGLPASSLIFGMPMAFFTIQRPVLRRKEAQAVLLEAKREAEAVKAEQKKEAEAKPQAAPAEKDVPKK